jgi:hypothetical protein
MPDRVIVPKSNVPSIAGVPGTFIAPLRPANFACPIFQPATSANDSSPSSTLTLPGWPSSCGMTPATLRPPISALLKPQASGAGGVFAGSIAKAPAMNVPVSSFMPVRPSVPSDTVVPGSGMAGVMS